MILSARAWCLATTRSTGSRRMLKNFVGLQKSILESALVDGGTPPDRVSLLRAIHRDGTNAGGHSNFALASPWVSLSVRGALDSIPDLNRLASANVAASPPLADALAATGTTVGPEGSFRLKPRAVRWCSCKTRKTGLVEDGGVRRLRTEVEARNNSVTYDLSGFGWLGDKWGALSVYAPARSRRQRRPRGLGQDRRLRLAGAPLVHSAHRSRDASAATNRALRPTAAGYTGLFQDL